MGYFFIVYNNIEGGNVMRVEYLEDKRIKDFIGYCKRYRTNIDNAYLTDEELESFVLNEESPTYILLDDDNKIVGAASLVLDKYHRMEKVGRFRIFHSSKLSSETYKLMLSSVLNHGEGLNELINFAKEDDKETRNILEQLDFTIECYLYAMIRGEKPIKEVSFPEGFELRTFKKGRDEEDWCEIRNIGFGTTDSAMNPEEVSIYWEDDNGYIEGGMMLLYHENKPVGSIRASEFFEDGTCYILISNVCVKPEYRKRGLGKNLLRAGLQFGKDRGMPRAALDVDTENENALDLYINEGFIKDDSNVCYKYNLRQENKF